MNIRYLQAICTTAAFFSLAAVHASDSAFQIKTDLGVIESWRVAPQSILKWCEKADPDGIESRNTSNAAWLQRNRELIAQVDQKFNEVVPLITPSMERVKAVDAVRAHIATEVLKATFLGKNEEEIKSICKMYSPAEDQKWGDNKIEMVKQSLGKIENWKESNGH